MKYGKLNLFLFSLALLGITSCGEPDPSKLPTISTPANAQVDLSKISLSISNATITRINNNNYRLNFDYTLTNTAGAHLSFVCIYDSTDEMIEVELTDQMQQRIVPSKRPMEGLTLTEPRPLKILHGSTTRNYQAPLMPELRDAGDPITLRVRLHAPSRYDELRSSIEAPSITIPWP